MPVHNVVLKTIEARRFQDPSGAPMQLRIDHNSHLSLVEADGDRLSVEFTFTTSYGAMGVIKMEGRLQMTTPEAKAAAEEYAKSRNLPPAIAQQVHSAILQAGVPEAVGLSKTVRLPPPIPLPQVKIGGQDAKAATTPGPSESPETA